MFSYKIISRIPFLFLQALKFVHRNILRRERNWPYNTNPFSQDLENDEKCLEKFGILTANAKDVKIHQSLVPIWMLLYAPTIQARIYALYMHIHKLFICLIYVIISPTIKISMDSLHLFFNTSSFLKNRLHIDHRNRNDITIQK